MHFCGEYSDCYGNGGCDGFAPYFPLIRPEAEPQVYCNKVLTPCQIYPLFFDKKTPLSIEKGVLFLIVSKEPYF